MPNTNLIRLYINQPLQTGSTLTPDQKQSHYLTHVMRLKLGDHLAVFNGRDGEWLCALNHISRKEVNLVVLEPLNPQADGPPIDYYFAPLKKARLDYMVQKATEVGVRSLTPIFTQHTQVERVKKERMQANAIEAAEQCGLLQIPKINEPLKLTQLIDDLSSQLGHNLWLIFCDEGEPDAYAIDQLNRLKLDSADKEQQAEFGVVVGPEGGFSEEERLLLRNQPFVIPISLGPRIMRADTAAIAALTLINAILGDWSD